MRRAEKNVLRVYISETNDKYHWRYEKANITALKIRRLLGIKAERLPPRIRVSLTLVIILKRIIAVSTLNIPDIKLSL